MSETAKFNNIPLNLEILAEEAAEVCRIKSKVIRFGIDDYHPKNKMNNRESLTEEIGHFLAMVDILVENKVVAREGLEKAKREKIINLPEWYEFLA